MLENEKVPAVLALGAFDGLHRGHMAVIGQAVELGKKLGITPGVFTFAEDPSMLLAGKTDYLITREEKGKLLQNLGIRRIYAVDFAKVRDMAPEAFVNTLLFEELQAKALCCGADFRFGKQAAGDTALLERLCARAGVSLTVVPPLMDSGAPVSATRIRNALEAGDIPLASKLLGRSFGFSFTVVEGNRIGRTLGTPTINQKLPDGFVQPRFGVYASIVYVDGGKHCGVTNIGVKPTVGKYAPLSETWIPDFEKDMYGMKIRVELIEFIRPEQKFQSLDALRAEIHQNAALAKTICRPYLEK